MEPITLLITALVTGLSAGLTDVAQKAVGEVFNAFNARLQQKIAGHPDAENALQAVESKPESQARQAVLKEELESLEAQKDAQLLGLAQAVLQTADPDGAQAGKYKIAVSGSQGVTIGDHATVTQTFNAPPSETDRTNP